MKSTKGPWEVDSERRWIRAVPDDCIVATVERDIHHKGESEANATLIAAAPEMLDALIAVYRELAELPFSVFAKLDEKMLSKVQQAIMNAGGSK